MRATLLLCDYAAVADGKLFISGGGWSVTGPTPSPSAIALKLDVPWDLTNTTIRFKLRLLDQDGDPVMQPAPVGQVAIEVNGQFEVGRPPGLLHGTPIDVPLAVNLPPLPLTPGRRFSWELSVNEETREDWHLAFQTRNTPPRPDQGHGPPTQG